MRKIAILILFALASCGRDDGRPIPSVPAGVCYNRLGMECECIPKGTPWCRLNTEE